MVNMFTEAIVTEMTAPIVTTATYSTSGINVGGYTGNAFYVYYGAAGDTLSAADKIECKLEECSTSGGSYSDVATADVYYPSGTATNSFGLIDADAEAGNVYAIGYDGDEKYVKVTATFTGTHATGTPVCVFAVQGMPRSQTTDGEANP